MLRYLEILEKVPSDLKGPLVELAETIEERIRTQLLVSRVDFSSLRATVEEIAQMQKEAEERQKKADEKLSKSEGRLDRIEAIVEETARMQKEAEERFEKVEGRLDRVETIVEELRQAQKRTDERFEELAQAQKRTEERLDRLESVVEELAQAQKRTEEGLNRLEATFEKFERTFVSKMGALGARWGLGSEAAFREGMRGLLRDTELKVERYLSYDKSGQVFGRPDQVELDLVIKDSEVYLVEIKSSLGRSDVSLFERKVKFYEEKEGRTPSRKIVIALFVEPGAMEMAEDFDMEVYSDINELYR